MDGTELLVGNSGVLGEKPKVHWLRGHLDRLLLSYGKHSWGMFKTFSFSKINERKC